MKKTLLTMIGMSVAAAAMAASFGTIPEESAPFIKGNFNVPQITEGLSDASLTRADGDMKTIVYTVGYNPATATSIGQNGVGVYLWQAIRVSADVATEYEGATVKSINFYNGINAQTEKNSITSGTVYLCSSLGNNPEIITSQTFKATSNPFEYNEIVLDQPYTIEKGKEFYVAYAITMKSAYDYALVIDNMPTDNPNGCIIGLSDGRQYQWYTGMGEIYGSLSISATIEGENLPVDGMEVVNVTGTNYTLVDKDFNLKVAVAPDTSTPVNNFTIEYSVPGGEKEVQDLSITQSVGYHQMVSGQFTLKCTEVGDQPIEFTITKVNGKPNTSKNASFTFRMLSQDPEVGYQRTYLIEEGTGTWCGWCPAGIEFMDWAKRKYPEVIRVAVHAGDEMQVDSADEIIDLFEGYPTALVNRALTVGPSSSTGRKEFVNYMTSMDKIPAFVEFTELNVTDVTSKSAKVSGKVRFAVDLKDVENRFGISFSATEDGVGPYMQQNYYAKGNPGNSTQMGDWNDKPAAVSTIYDDVLRVLDGGLKGYTEFIPKDIKAGEEYKFEKTIKLSNLNIDGGFMLNAILTDNWSGEISSSRQAEICASGVESIAAGDANVVSEIWYDLNGIRLEAPAKGINIKRTQLSDGTVRHSKVMIAK